MQLQPAEEVISDHLEGDFGWPLPLSYTQQSQQPLADYNKQRGLPHLATGSPQSQYLSSVY